MCRSETRGSERSSNVYRATQPGSGRARFNPGAIPVLYYETLSKHLCLSDSDFPSVPWGDWFSWKLNFFQLGRGLFSLPGDNNWEEPPADNTLVKETYKWWDFSSTLGQRELLLDQTAPRCPPRHPAGLRQTWGSKAGKRCHFVFPYTKSQRGSTRTLRCSSPGHL